MFDCGEAERSNYVDFLEQSAAEDLLAAEIILHHNDELLTNVSFHLQQFIEKRMKASLCKHMISYPKTNDLVKLLTLFPGKKVSSDDEAFAYTLSRFAAKSRYGDGGEIPWDGGQMMVKAKEFVEAVEKFWNDQ